MAALVAVSIDTVFCYALLRLSKGLTCGPDVSRLGPPCRPETASLKGRYALADGFAAIVPITIWTTLALETL